MNTRVKVHKRGILLSGVFVEKSLRVRALLVCKCACMHLFVRTHVRVRVQIQSRFVYLSQYAN